MDNSVFRGWAEQLRLRGLRDEDRAMHVELIDLVRRKFPQQSNRYGLLSTELQAIQAGGEPLFVIRPPVVTDDFTQWFDGARNGNRPDFRALLLKWLWVRHHDEAQGYLARWGIEVSSQASLRRDPETPPSKRMVDILTILPVQGLNFVFPGDQPEEENAIFSYTVTVNLLSMGIPFILTGCCFRLLAGDGAMTLPGEQQIFVNGKKQETSGDDVHFNPPISLHGGTAQIRCQQKVRPPRMRQTPQQCIRNSSINIEVLGLIDNSEESLTRHFRFTGHGNLVPFDGVS